MPALRLALLLILAPPPIGPQIEDGRSQLEAAPAAAEELCLAEMYLPAGRRGLEYSPRALSLENRRARVAGYMVRRDQAPSGTLLLAPMPVQLHDHEYGLADDLPPATILVEVPGTGVLPYTPGLLELTGTLFLGPTEMADGRLLHVRLVLDAPEVETVVQPLSSPIPDQWTDRAERPFRRNQ